MTAIFSRLVAAFVTWNVVECIDAWILDVGFSGMLHLEFLLLSVFRGFRCSSHLLLLKE